MKSRLDKKQYDLLVSSVKSENISEWNEWYAAHLKDTIHLRGTSVFGAHLDGADLSYLNLEGADLRFASLQGADFSYSYLKDANLEGANLFSANLWRASLDGTNLEGANPDSANFEPAGRLKFDAVQAELFAGNQFNSVVPCIKKYVPGSVNKFARIFFGRNNMRI